MNADEIVKQAVEAEARQRDAADEGAIAVATAREMGVGNEAIARALDHAPDGSRQSATRTVPGPAEEVRAHVAWWLEKNGFEPRQRGGSVEIWAPTLGARWNDMRPLWAIESIEVYLTEEDGQTSVALLAERSRHGRKKRMAIMGVGIAGSLTCLAALIFSTNPFYYNVLLAIFMVTSVVLAGAHWSGIRHPEAKLLEEALDKVEHRALTGAVRRGELPA